MNVQQILIVEDEPFLAQELKFRLEELGYAVAALVVNGPAAIEHCAKSKPDLVLMDIVLEGDMDGIETAQIIHGRFNVPIVYLTAYADDQLLARASITEPFGYILKPYNERELHVVIAIALHNARMLAQLTQSRQQLLDGLEPGASQRTLQLEVANKELKHEAAIRKQAESALQLSEERFRYGQIYANIGTWDWNVQTGDLHWSEMIAPLFGYADGELETTYENFLQAVHPDDRQSVVDAVAACVEKGVVYNIEHRIVWPDSTVRWVHESGNVILAEDGTPLRMLGVVRDITRRKQIELPLKNSERRLKEAQHIGHIGNWSWDVASGKLFWSDEIYRIFGQEPGAFEPTYERFIAMLHPDDVKRIKQSEQAAFAQGKKHAIDHRIILSDGSVRWVHEEAIAEIDSAGNPLSLAGTVQDITGRKRAEYELIRAKERAEIANHAKSEFLSRMSHELRTPLNAILGFSQLLECDNDCPLAPSQKEHVDHIVKAGWHLLDLINQVLDLSLIESDGLALAIEKIELRPLVEECVALVSAMVQSRSIRIVDEIGASTPRFLHGDKTRVRQILLNLLSNAIKYNRQGGEVRLSCNASTDGWVRISVNDTGHGIPQDQLDHLFQPFERLDINKNEVDGTGVGLALVKRLAEVMEGNVGVESVLGQGSTFWFELPGGSEPGAKQPVELAVQPVLKPTYRVLYVEDNAANLRLVTKILQSNRNDITVIAAATAEAGIELVKAHGTDLILMDINLPGMDGMQALAHLRHDMLSQEIPIIAVSADAMPYQVEMGMAAGFDRYLTKPIMIPALLEAVGEFLPVIGK